MTNSILVDMNRCTGCWTCSMSCKVAHGLDTSEFWQYVRTVGGGEIDQPGGEWPNLYLKWMPVWKPSCKSCHGEGSTGNIPYCVFNCPAGALTFGDSEDPESEFSKRADALRKRGFRVYQIPEWEDTRKDIYYAEKGI